MPDVAMIPLNTALEGRLYLRVILAFKLPATGLNLNLTVGLSAEGMVAVVGPMDISKFIFPLASFPKVFTFAILSLVIARETIENGDVHPFLVLNKAHEWAISSILLFDVKVFVTWLTLKV